MHIRRRNNEHLRIKRNNRKAKSSETFNSLFGTPFKLLIIWATILMLDFFTDFRFEFIYSCWLFVRTMIDSFRYQGLAFALFFTLIAMMSDVVCYFLVPTTLVYLLGSSFVWIQLVWQSDRGFYAPTIVLCFIFVYVEIAVRLRDPKYLPLGIDICRPFATHCVGYPAVTFGFVLKTMVSHHFRQRRQRSVEAQNATFFALLEEALPKELRQYLKTDDSSSKSNKSLPSPSDNRPALPAGSGPLLSTNRSLGSKDKIGSRKHTAKSDPNSAAEIYRHSAAEARQIMYSQLNESTQSDNVAESISNTLPDADSIDKVDDAIASPPTALWSTADQMDLEFSFDEVGASEQHSQTVQTPKAPSSVSSTTSTSSSSSTCSSSSLSSAFVVGHPSRSTLSAFGGKLSDRKQSVANPGSASSVVKSPVSTVSSTHATGMVKSTNKSGSTHGSGTKNANKDEYTLKLEVELKQLRTELQSLRGLEVDLRAQVQQLTAAERTFRSESSQARQESETLQTKIVQLTQRLETDRANLRSAEERLIEERKQRVALEQKLSAQQQSRPNASKSPKSSSAEDSVQLTVNKASSVKSAAAPLRDTSSPGTNNSSSTTFTSSSSISTTTFTQTTAACTASDSCATRVKELEYELRTLKRDLAEREAQLASLKESRVAHGVNGSDATASGKKGSLNRIQEDSTERDELLSQLAHLQEENQRMTDTLKDEDKMKQELLTAYHASLKEITELNASLTKKEFQIVELNMRLESLTPHLCEYLNMMNVATKHLSNAAPSETNTSADQGAYTMFSSEMLPRHTNSTASMKGQHNMRKFTSDDPGFPDGRSAHTPSNGLNHNYFGSPLDYPTSTYGSSFSDSIGMCNPPRINSITNSTVTNMDASLHSSMTNGVSRTHHGFSNRSFPSTTDHLSVNQVYTSTQSNQLPSYTRQSPRTSANFTHFNSSQFELTSYPQHNRFKSAVSPYPGSGTRPLPVGSAAPTSSPPPFLLPPPGLMHSNINPNLMHSSSLASDSHPFSSSHPTNRPLEVLVNTSGTMQSDMLHSPVYMDMGGQNSSPVGSSSVNRLIESLSLLGSSSESSSFNHQGRRTVADSFPANSTTDATMLYQHPDASNFISLNAATRNTHPYRIRGTYEDMDLMDANKLNLMGLNMLDGSLVKPDGSTTDGSTPLQSTTEDRSTGKNSEVDGFGHLNPGLSGTDRNSVM